VLHFHNRLAKSFLLNGRSQSSDDVSFWQEKIFRLYC